MPYIMTEGFMLLYDKQLQLIRLFFDIDEEYQRISNVNNFPI